MTEKVAINVRLELTHAQLSVLADMIDGKATKREATRKQVVAICEQHIGGLVSQTEYESKTPDRVWPNFSKTEVKKLDNCTSGDIVIDDEDRVVLAGKPQSYIRGWYQVKRSKR